MEEPTRQNLNQPSQTAKFSLPDSLDILKESWLIYKKRIKTFLGITIIPTLVTIVLMALIMGTAFFNPSLINTNPEETFMGAFSFWTAIMFFIAILIQIWSQAALIFAIKDSQEGIGIKESYKRASSKIVSFIWVSFLTWIIVFAGFMFFIIPGIIFALWFCFSALIVIDENIKGTQAILKSKEYVQGMMGAIFWKFLFITFVILALAIIAALFSGGLLTPIVSFLATPFAVIYYFLVYKKVKEIKSAKQY